MFQNNSCDVLLLIYFNSSIDVLKWLSLAKICKSEKVFHLLIVYIYIIPLRQCEMPYIGNYYTTKCIYILQQIGLTI